jgi:hypothetical protein
LKLGLRIYKFMHTIIRVDIINIIRVYVHLVMLVKENIAMCLLMIVFA